MCGRRIRGAGAPVAFNARSFFTPQAVSGTGFLLVQTSELWVQWAILDAAAQAGVSLSNAIKGVTPQAWRADPGVSSDGLTAVTVPPVAFSA
jgi:hypothetical protein